MTCLMSQSATCQGLAALVLTKEVSLEERVKMWLDLELMISCVQSAEIKSMLACKTLLMKREHRPGSSWVCQREALLGSGPRVCESQYVLWVQLWDLTFSLTSPTNYRLYMIHPLCTCDMVTEQLCLFPIMCDQRPFFRLPFKKMASCVCACECVYVHVCPCACVRHHGAEVWTEIDFRFSFCKIRFEAAYL